MAIPCKFRRDCSILGQNIINVLLRQQQVSGFVQTLKCFFQDFPGHAITKFQGFPGLKNPFFHDFPGHVPFTNMGCMRSKKCIDKISYQCICNTVRMQKCNTWGCIIEIQWTQISPASSISESRLINNLHQLLSLVYNSRTFLDFRGPVPFSRTFQGLEF